MKNRVENYLPAALEAVEKIILDGDPNGTVPRPFKGYISSFGAAVIQTGLLPAIAFYSVKGGAEEERGKVIKAIRYILQTNKVIDDNIESLLKFLVDNKENSEYYKDYVMDAATALQLALRTFKIEK